MNALKKKIPIGIENFEDIVKEDFYYIDKTDLISELLNNWASVTLFTRPRRFGKSLNMSMLECFLSINKDQSVFGGLETTKYAETLMDEGVSTILKYGIACYKRHCKVVVE